MAHFGKLGCGLASLVLATGQASAAGSGLPVMPSLSATSPILSAGELVSALATINGGFFNQNNAFVSSPENPQADQIGGGPWVRATGGTFNTQVSGAVTGLPATTVKTNSDYVGVQGAADIGRYNIGNSGYSVNFGLTGGNINIGSTGPLAIAKANFDVPFVGGYVAFAGHGFFADALIRADFFNLTTSPSLFSQSSTSITGAVSAGYRYDTPYLFIAPSVGLSVSHLEGGSSALTATPALGIANGTVSVESIDSQLGRLNLTVGKDLVFSNVVASPFFTASVFHEFAGPVNVTFVDQSTAATFVGRVGRIGTYGQFSVGGNAKVLGTGLLTFVRADFRTGDHTDGYGVSGGLRYQF